MPVVRSWLSREAQHERDGGMGGWGDGGMGGWGDGGME